MSTELDPVWTDRAPTMRILDPLGVESIEGSLQDRLLRPVLSIAITQRLRYLSYWAWITAHVEKHTSEQRALYEKALLVASTAHDCPDEGTGTSGIMGGTDALEAELEEPDTEAINISPAAFTITSSDVSRFDAYYKGIAYRLLLFEDEWTLTPLGRRLANAYDDVVDVDPAEIVTAAENERLPLSVVEQLQEGGCLCQLTDTEQELLTRAYWFLVTPTDHYDELAFGREPGPDLLELEEYLATTPDETDSEAVIEATLAGTDEATDADYSEDLELFFASGRDAFVRSSLVLLLALGDWVTRRPTSTPDFTGLEDSREVWRLLVHSEYTSHAIQALFIAVQEAIRLQEPITPPELLTSLFDHDTFDQAAGRALSGLEITEQDGDRDVLDGIRDAVYFDSAPAGPLAVTIDATAGPLTGSWADVTTALQETDPADTFGLTGHSERAYRTLIDETLASVTSIDGWRRVAAYSAVQLARIASRYGQYFGTEAQAPSVEWFRTAHDDPGPITCWELQDAHPTAPAHETIDGADWASSQFALTAAAFTQHWTLTQYFKRLYEKIKDSNGKSPQLLQLDTDGRLSFDYQGNGGAVYNEGRPNAPTLKFDRLGDICYELGLIEDNSLSGMVVTEQGRQLVESFTTGGQP